jgi:hypothetical protein
LLNFTLFKGGGYWISEVRLGFKADLTDEEEVWMRSGDTIGVSEAVSGTTAVC